jgi:hypothetical protein
MRAEILEGNLHLLQNVLEMLLELETGVIGSEE